MAFYYSEPSHTFSEYLLIPGYTAEDCVPANVSLRTPLTRFRKGEEPAISLNIPMVSAIMQSVSDDKLAIALAKEGGLSFIYGAQSIESEAAMVARVKNHKAGFVVSASNLTPDSTLADVLALKAKNGYSTVAITDDGTANGRLLGIVSSRDYRVSRMDGSQKVSTFMTPLEKLVTAPAQTTLKEANDIIWEHKLNSLPIVDADGRLLYFVFRKDYASHKENPLELLDDQKRYLVGAGVNTRDYQERIPALLAAGADVLCIDSSEGYSCWQEKTIAWVREQYGDSVKIGAGNVVDRDGFLFLAKAGADFVKVGIGGGSICITRETKGIGRGQATALIEVCAARDEYYRATGVFANAVCRSAGMLSWFAFRILTLLSSNPRRYVWWLSRSTSWAKWRARRSCAASRTAPLSKSRSFSAASIWAFFRATANKRSLLCACTASNCPSPRRMKRDAGWNPFCIFYPSTMADSMFAEIFVCASSPPRGTRRPARRTRSSGLSTSPLRPRMPALCCARCFQKASRRSTMEAIPFLIPRFSARAQGISI